jgi:hypothetical protein
VAEISAQNPSTPSSPPAAANAGGPDFIRLLDVHGAQLDTMASNQEALAFFTSNPGGGRLPQARHARNGPTPRFFAPVAGNVGSPPDGSPDPMASRAHDPPQCRGRGWNGHGALRQAETDRVDDDGGAVAEAAPHDAVAGGLRVGAIDPAGRTSHLRRLSSCRGSSLSRNRRGRDGLAFCHGNGGCKSP